MSSDEKPQRTIRIHDAENGFDALGVQADPKLLADGWVRRHLADPVRAAESEELYRQMGFEVKVQELKPEDFGAECETCASSICKTYVMIYTRKSVP